MKKYDIIVIGAGPAGVLAALTAARNGRKVALIEKNEQIGKKLLATGNGRCNLTNKNIALKNYHGGDAVLTMNVIKNYDQNRVIDFFESMGVILKEEENGRIFPRTNQASTIVGALQEALNDKAVDVLLGTEVKQISKNNMWEITCTKGLFSSDKLIITTGGRASFFLGSSGDGLFWAKKFGHSISEIYAGLVPIEIVEQWPAKIQGLKVEASIISKLGEKIIRETKGDLLFTHYGISGPSVMAQSRHIAPFLKNGSVELVLDFYPEMNEKELDGLLRSILESNRAKALKNTLIGLVPLNLMKIIIEETGIDLSKKSAEISKDDRARIIRSLKMTTLHVKSLRPLKEAQITAGGVDLAEVKITLESKIISDLYFAGEVLDVDGDSGGFNLQWAWSSGYTAGFSASR